MRELLDMHLLSFAQANLLPSAKAHLLSSAKVLRFREISSNEVKVRAAAGVVRSRLVTQPR